MRLARTVLLFLLLLGWVGSVHGQDPTPSSARLNGLRFEFQTWCNCGPVNLTMVLSYYGWQHDQTAAAGWLKPRVEDKNVSPDQLVAFVYHQTELPLGALWRPGGTIDQIKRLIAAGFPVIIESGFQPEGLEWMGHYMTIVAYDDAQQTMWVYDSYEGLGPDYLGIQHTYAELDFKLAALQPDTAGCLSPGPRRRNSGDTWPYPRSISGSIRRSENGS